jgi:hypothetical protein
VNPQVANNFAILILCVRPLETTRHAQVVKAVESQRDVGLQYDAVIIRCLAPDIQEDLKGHKV